MAALTNEYGQAIFCQIYIDRQKRVTRSRKHWAMPGADNVASNGAGFTDRVEWVGYLEVDRTRRLRKPLQGPRLCKPGHRGEELKWSCQRQPRAQMIGRMIAPPAQLMLLGRPNVQISTFSN